MENQTNMSGVTDVLFLLLRNLLFLTISYISSLLLYCVQILQFAQNKTSSCELRIWHHSALKWIYSKAELKIFQGFFFYPCFLS